MPFFSIVIPSYNRAELLSETLNSIKKQVFTDWECIVVDDGSTDHTREVIQKEIEADPRIRYIYQENAERSAARNNGARNAKGLFVCFLDSDDQYAHNYLQELYKQIENDGRKEVVYVTDFLIWDGVHFSPTTVAELVEPIGDWLFYNPVSPSRVCVHSDILKKYKFREDIVIVEDTVLWVSIANEYPIRQVKKPLVWYRVHEGNSVSKGTKSAFSRATGMRKFFSEELSLIVSKKVKKEMLSDVTFRIAEYHQSKGKHFETIRAVLLSVWICPSHVHTKLKLFFLLEYVPGFKFLWERFISKKR